MQITKKNFALGKILKVLGDPESSSYGLHITREHTEITNGHFAIRMTHSEQREFEFAPDLPIDVRLSPEDAVNIASSLGKENHIKAVMPAQDRESVQVEFDSGEIRILRMRDEPYPDIDSVTPSNPPLFTISLDVDYLIAILQAIKATGMTGAMLEFRGSRDVVVIRPAMQSENPVVQALLMPRLAEGLIDIGAGKRAMNGRAADAEEDQRAFPLN